MEAGCEAGFFISINFFKTLCLSLFRITTNLLFILPLRCHPGPDPGSPTPKELFIFSLLSCSISIQLLLCHSLVPQQHYATFLKSFVALCLQTTSSLLFIQPHPPVMLNLFQHLLIVAVNFFKTVCSQTAQSILYPYIRDSTFRVLAVSPVRDTALC
jgi:hypothetical protein